MSAKDAPISPENKMIARYVATAFGGTPHVDEYADWPADLMSDALHTVVHVREQRGRSKPTLQELIDGIAAALQGTETSTEDGEQLDRRRIIVTLEPAVVSTRATPTTDEQIVATFREAIVAIAEEFEKRWGRKPRLRELPLRPDTLAGGANRCEGRTMSACWHAEANAAPSQARRP